MPPLRYRKLQGIISFYEERHSVGIHTIGVSIEVQAPQ